MDKKILIALDTGFEGCKIVVNGVDKFNVPFVLQDITGKEDSYGMKRTDDKFIRCGIEEHSYVIGEVAKTALLNNEQRRNTMYEDWYTMNRFSMPLFEHALSAYISYALWHYTEKEDNSLLSELSEYKIEVGIALPHSYVGVYEKKISEYLLGEAYINKMQSQKKQHSVLLQVGGNSPIKVEFVIAKVSTNSQMLCMLLNDGVDDEGEDIIENDTVYNNLPAVLIDAGYKTFADSEFTRAEDFQNDESNVEFAMMNINEAVAKAVQLETGDENSCKGYMVDKMAKDDEYIRYLDGGKVKSISIKKKKEEMFDKYSIKMIEYLLNKYNNLLDIKMILIGGGTGKLYYEAIQKFCEAERPYIKVALAGEQIAFGEKCEAIYAVAMGLYKSMLFS